MLSKTSISLTPSTEVDLVRTLAERVETLERAFIKTTSRPSDPSAINVPRVVTEVIQELEVDEPDFERRLRHALEGALRRQQRVGLVDELTLLEKEGEDRPSVSKSSKRKLTQEEREERARLAQEAKQKREQEEAERKLQILEKKQMAEQDRLVKKMMEEEARAEKKRLLEEAKAKREQLREEQARLKREQREALARLKEKRPLEEKGSQQKISKKSKTPIPDDEETVLFVKSKPGSSSSSSSSSSPPVTRTVVVKSKLAAKVPPVSSPVDLSEHEWEESEMDDASSSHEDDVSDEEVEEECAYEGEPGFWELPSFEGLTWEEWSKDEEGEDTSSYTYTSISGFEDYIYSRDGAEKKIVYANCEGGVHQPDTLAVGHYSSTEGGSTQVHFHPNYSWLISVNQEEL